MTNQEFVSNLQEHFPEICKRMLSVDTEPLTLEEFIQVNLLEDGVDHISIEEAQSVVDMKVGETLYFGMGVAVERVS